MKTISKRARWVLIGGASLLVLALVLFLGWRAWSWTSDRAFWADVAQILQGVVLIPSIIWGVLRYRRVSEDQRKAKHYQAWQAISDAQGKPGSGGRLTALQDLHADGVELVGVDLSGGAFLAGLKLPRANLAHAHLEGANLWEAHLEGALLLKAHLEGADLDGAHLEEAVLASAYLKGAILFKAHLEGTRLDGAHLEGTRLDGAHLEGANLGEAHLEGACLNGAHLEGAYLNGAHLEGVTGFTKAQVLSARDWRRATLPAEPSDVKALELPTKASEEDMDRLGRKWKSLEAEDSSTGK